MATVTASYSGVNTTANLTVNAAGPTLRADFAVTPTGGAPGNPGQCAVFSDERNGRLVNELRCIFDGSISTSPTPITEYRWTFPTGANQTVQFVGPRLDRPTVACATFANAAEREVTLTITAASGADTIRKMVTFIKSNPC
jgi:hypothetical protein